VKGVPLGYNLGAESRREIPSGHLLHYARGHSLGDEWWTRSEGETDYHGHCPFCNDEAAASPLVEEYSVSWDHEAVARPSGSDDESISDWSTPSVEPPPPHHGPPLVSRPG
jgi:hypothetical protein